MSKIKKNFNEILFVASISCIFILGLVITFFVFNNKVQLERNEFEKKFQSLASEKISYIKEKLNDTITILEGVQSFYAASNYVDTEEFNIFTDHFIKTYSLIESVGFIEKIDKNNLNQKIQIFSKENIKLPTIDFNILPEEEQKQFIFKYTQPYHENSYIIGTNLISSKDFTKTLDYSARYNKIMATKAFANESTRNKSDILLFAPIYENDKPLNSELERIKNLYGYTYIFMKLKPIINEAISKFDLNNIGFILKDVTRMNNTYVVYDYNLSSDIKDLSINEMRQRDNLIKEDIFEFAGRKWMILAVQNQKFTASNSAYIYAGFCLLITVFMTFIANLLKVQNKRVAHLVKIRTEQLEREKQRAETADRMKGEFLANMSHEIRTPMNGILGMAELLSETDINEKQKKYIETLNRSGNILVRIINDILDFSKIESGKLTFEEKPLDLAMIYEDVSKLYLHRLIEKNLKIYVNFLPNIYSKIKGDHVRITQILSNLVSNAIKFTESGYIEMSLKELSSNDSHITFEIAIEDTGIGITEDQKELVFKKFSQADASTTRKYGGTGLGLTIVKRLVELMDGEMGVDSEPEIGSKFWIKVTFPKAKLSEEDNYDITNKKLLLVGEKKEILVMYKKFLTEVGGVVKQINYEELESEKNKDSYDAIILDQNSDNDDIKAIIEEETKLNVFSKYIQLSDQYDEPNYKNLTCIQKPISSKILVKAIQEINKKTQLATKSIQEVDKKISNENIANISGKRVLLVEDNHMNQILAYEWLVEWGLDVAICDNGKIACDLVQEEQFDIILMDCQMPVMDGFVATMKIKTFFEKGEMKPIPIIAITANAMKEDKEKCINAGMDDYLSKPLKKQLLFNKIEKWLNKDCSNDITSVAEEEEQDEYEVHINFKEFKEAENDMGENFDRYVKIYLVDTEKYIDLMKELLSNNNYNELEIKAHILKGSSKQFGFQKLYKQAKTIENLSLNKDQGLDPEELFSHIEDLHNNFNEIKPFLQEIIRNKREG